MSRKPTYPIDNRLLDDLREKLKAVENDWEHKFLAEILNAVKYGDIEKLAFVEMRKIQYLHRKYCATASP